MPYPSIYSITYSYTGFQQSQGNNDFPGTQLDSDLAGLQASIQGLETFTQGVMRSDGALNNGVVTYDSLAPSLQTAGLAPAVAWTTATAFLPSAAVTINSNLYRCLVAHTSGVFATDLAAGKWVLVSALVAGPAGTNGANALTYGGASVTSLLIANLVTKTFATQAGLAYQVGNYMRASSAANGGNYMEGIVTAYVGTSLSISISSIGGSGTFADWNFAIAGSPGIGVSSFNGLSGAITFAVAPQGRGTLTSGVAVTVSDVVGATIAYYVSALSAGPAPPAYVPLWNGGAFISTSFTQLVNDITQSVTGKSGAAAAAANSIYDFYVWNDAGTVRLTRSAAWASDTSRGTGAGTAEVDFTTAFPTNKQAVTNGPAAGFGTLVFSARTDGSSQLKDTKAFRWLSNLYNYVPRPMSVVEATASWPYTTAAYRQANANTANQLDFIQCGAGAMLVAHVSGNSGNTSVGVLQTVGIGINQVTTNNASNWAVQNSPVASAVMPLVADYVGYVPFGRSFAAWLEYSAASGTTTWYANLSPGVTQAGISGWINN